MFKVDFDNPEAVILQSPDYFLGIGNKKKKAEKKLKKAEKALAHGNTQKAQKKIDKALKKLGKDDKHDVTGVIERAAKDQANVNEIQQAKQDSISAIEASKGTTSSVAPAQSSGITPYDPVTRQDAPNVSGSGSSMPLVSGGGGGDMSEEMQTSYAPQTEAVTTDGQEQEETQNVKDNGKNFIKIGIIIAVVVVMFVLIAKSFKKKK